MFRAGPQGLGPWGVINQQHRPEKRREGMFPELRARTRQKGLCCKGFCDFMSIEAVSSQARVGGELTLLPSSTSSLIPPLTKIDRKPEGNREK